MGRGKQKSPPASARGQKVPIGGGYLLNPMVAIRAKVALPGLEPLEIVIARHPVS